MTFSIAIREITRIFSNFPLKYSSNNKQDFIDLHVIIFFLVFSLSLCVSGAYIWYKLTWGWQAMYILKLRLEGAMYNYWITLDIGQVSLKRTGNDLVKKPFHYLTYGSLDLTTKNPRPSTSKPRGST